jgi:hypothetical protein
MLPRLVTLGSALAASAVAASSSSSAPTATMVFNQTEAVAVYDGVGISRHAAGSTFAVASSLNPPEFVEIYDAAGNVQWTFNVGAGTYLVDSARHLDTGASGTAVDTFAAFLGSNGGAVLYGLTSTSNTAKPNWLTTLDGCATDGGGGTYTGLQAADGGNAVAFLCHHAGAAGQNATARAYLIDGQSGAIKWDLDLGTTIQAGQGDISITSDGAYVLFVNENGVPTPNTATAYVIDGATGKVRGAPGGLTIPFFITAAITDSGDYVALGDEDVVHVWKWSGAAYAPHQDLAIPNSWIPWDVVASTGTDQEELIVVGAISDNVLQVQVTAFNVSTGAMTTNWQTTPNAKLQNNPTLRADGPFIGVSLWGDAGELPTVALLKSGSSTPLFTYVTPGSMFAVDIAVDTVTATETTVLLSAAGKHVPANAMGNGGDAYGWSIVVPN